MADIIGTSGNDIIQASSGGTLTLVVNATVAENVWPNMNVLINGTVVMGNITVTASHAAGGTQLVSVAIPAGTAITSVGIEYTNDVQSVYTQNEDRNLYLASVNLNGTELLGTSSTYFRTANNTSIDGQLQLINGQEAMVWGGTLTYSGSAVQSAPISTATGDPHINGGAGIDTVVFSGTEASYGTINLTSTGYPVGSTEVVNIERLQFADTKVAVDMDGHAGTTAELISAVFGSDYLKVKEYVGIGLQLLDGGMSPLQLAALAVQTPLFQNLAGSTSNTDFVRWVYHNVVGFDPSQDALNHYVGLLDSGAETQASLALMAAETSQNAVHLVGVMQHGIEFA